MSQTENFNTAKKSILPKLIINSTEFQCHLKNLTKLLRFLSGKNLK